MLLTFERLQDRPGLEIVDHVERRQCLLHTTEPVEPVEASLDEFAFPVDRGVRFETESLVIPYRMPVFIWNSVGFQIEELSKGESRELPEDRYTIEMTAPVKLYVVVESQLSIDVTADEVRLEFGSYQETLVSARSYHKNPAATITTTETPEDMMAAISVLSSALKATSVERSYPTLRGHPPTIELGDELDIPAGLERPDTGVTIEVPPELRYVFVVAPLAYYLGAEVVSGPVPKLITESGFLHELEHPIRGFEGEVERVLKQTFFLDCVTRTEGLYQVNLHERNVLEPNLNLDFEALYNAPLQEQIEAYLGVPYEVVESELPEWKLATHIELVPENVEILPFVINDLAVVRSAESQPAEESGASYGTATDPIRAADFTRGAADSTPGAGSAASPTLIQPKVTDSIEQAWVGEGAPVGASKSMIEAYRNRLDRQPTDGDIDITVVCNDTAMNDERDIVDDIYGSRGELPLDIHGHHELTVEELRAVLAQDTDFLHYIGHIDDRGFECSDGFLDASTLETTGVDAFLLNACTSYQQGMELIRAGSIAGVVTVEDVINSGAERIGSSLAKLLNHGFPFSPALNIAKGQSIVGGLYLVLGDGSIDIAQSESGVPALCELTIEDDVTMDYKTFPTFDKGIGTITIPHVNDNTEFFLAGGATGSFELSVEKFAEFVSVQPQPIELNGKLYWSDQIRVADLFNPE